jgi:hypothetical protein
LSFVSPLPVRRRQSSHPDKTIKALAIARALLFWSMQACLQMRKNNKAQTVRSTEALIVLTPPLGSPKATQSSRLLPVCERLGMIFLKRFLMV